MINQSRLSFKLFHVLKTLWTGQKSLFRFLELITGSLSYQLLHFIAAACNVIFTRLFSHCDICNLIRLYGVLLQTSMSVPHHIKGARGFLYELKRKISNPKKELYFHNFQPTARQKVLSRCSYNAKNQAPMNFNPFQKLESLHRLKVLFQFSKIMWVSN